MTWLPPDYEEVKPPSQFVKIENGKTKLRIMTEPKMGWCGWPDASGAKPVRRPLGLGPWTKEELAALGIVRQPKFFWLFVIFNYDEEVFQCWECDKVTIRDQIETFFKDSTWGDPRGYDLTIEKSGEMMDTKYNVIPTPPKKLDAQITSEFAELKYDLDKVFEGGYPFDVE